MSSANDPYETPPYDAISEEAVLGSLIKDRTRIPLVQKILPSPNAFFIPKNHVVCEFI